MNKYGTYFDETGRPLIKESLCAFMDVLGFLDQTEAAFKRDEGSDLFERFYGVHTAQIKNMSGSGKPRLWDVKVFTDNIVLGFPFWSDDGESEFGSIIFTIAQYQYAMAKAGFFVRGGVAMAPLFMDENTAFGPAIIEAYQLEQQARDPRIVLSEPVKHLVLQHTEYYAEPFDSPQNRDVIKDADGMLFVNYLDAANLGEYEGDIVDWDGLHQHKEQIEVNLQQWTKNPSVWAKYLWLASYHDWFVSLYEDVDGYESKIKIDGLLARTFPERLIKERIPDTATELSGKN